MTYADSCATALRFAQEWEAEYHGLLAARALPNAPPYSRHQNLNEAYQRGFQRGKEQLRIEGGDDGPTTAHL